MNGIVKISTNKQIDLDKISTRAPEKTDREALEARFSELARELGDLQYLLYAAQTHAVLVILQGMDTSGKDGTIREVFRDVNPTGCRVTSFKVPTALEMGHDFLWRVHHETPERGFFGIFNRSHYEDVLVVRVHELVPEAVWRQRYDQINAFERMLTGNGALVFKFFLHISKDEQEERLMERERDVTKAWKLSAADWTERRYWKDYQRAYEEAISRCGTDHAPWHIVPADQKWYRNLAVCETLVDVLRPLKAGWLADLKVKGEAELSAIRATRVDATTVARSKPKS